ncbi:MAG: hypothetical protein AAGE43_12275 [Pseudomonadota bacterium]
MNYRSWRCSPLVPLPWLTALCLLAATVGLAPTAFGESTPHSPPAVIETAAGVTVAALPGLSSCSANGRQSPSGLQHLTSVPGKASQLMFSDRRGQLYLTVADGDGAPPKVFLDLTKYQAFGFEAAGTGGLSGFALHPEFAQPGKAGFGRLYTSYSTRADTGRAAYLDEDAGTHESVIREWTLQDPESERFVGRSRELFRLGQLNVRHQIGFLAFNPTAKPGEADYGVLYATIGPAAPAIGEEGNPDATPGDATPENGILRINPLTGVAPARYGIPEDQSRNQATVPELWLKGLEDPRHLSWDQATGALFITGARHVYRIPRGTIPSTPTFSASDTLAPQLQQKNSDAQVYTSGYRYHGSVSSLRGHFVLADGFRKRLLHFPLPEPGRNSGSASGDDSVSALTEAPLQVLPLPALARQAGAEREGQGLFLGSDSAGELYLLTQSDGCIRHLSAQHREQ